MNSTRRTFLAAASGTWFLGMSGCAAPDWLVGASANDNRVTRPPAGERSDALGHVLNRCTFGARPGDRDDLLALAAAPEAAIDVWLERQLAPQTIDDEDCARRLRRFDSLDEPAGELYEYHERVLLRELTAATVLRAVHSRRQLHEVMVHFWSDHFNIDISKGECAWLKIADDRDVVRRHALGNFSALLRASAFSPAMLWYLDGRVNRKTGADERPNENYARELLELHTLGVHGGYTQRDVMEVARCLTGWTVRPKTGFFKGRVEFHAGEHDDGEKTVLGQWIPAGLGAKDIELVLDRVADHPATATHLASKLCRRFIADEPPASAVATVAAAFSASAGDIAATLRALFRTPEFRAEAAMGAKLKRPFHFLVSALRATAAESDAGPALTEYLARMGHAPFQFPTPDGYADTAAAWTGTLLWRWQLAAALAGNRVTGTRIDQQRLRARLGGADGVTAHVLGRQPDQAERVALSDAGEDSLALLLASPAFQRC